MLEHKELTEAIIGAAIEVHRHLGPGLLESAYQKCLMRELELRSITFECEVRLPLEYKGIRVSAVYQMDLVVAGIVVVEIKAVAQIERVHEAQLMTYLRLSGKRVGLLINFPVRVLKNGIVRRIL
jgi:GxxExxY protein